MTDHTMTELPELPELAGAADCPHCGHRLEQHDRVALRYCGASGDHEAQRGCICHGLITTAADAANR